MSARGSLTSRAFQAWWDRRHPEWAATSTPRPHVELAARDLPRYVADRAAIAARGRFGPPQPWITRESLLLLDQLLRPTDHGIEWGAGGTTPWFAARVAQLTSIEGFARWGEPLAARLRAAGVTNVDLHVVAAERLGYESEEHRAAYVGVRPDLAPESLDFVFVDGEYRDDCALRGLDLLRPGGVLILDNATTYLPSPSRSPWKVDAPVTSGWERFTERVAGWRRVWTTNGVWDTALWFKP